MKRLVTVLCAMLLVSALSGCLFGFGTNSTDKLDNDIQLRNTMADSINVSVLITKNGSEVYNNTHMVKDNMYLRDAVSKDAQYNITVSAAGLSVDRIWNATNLVKFVFLEDRIEISQPSA